MANKAREITQNTIKRLYGLSGNVCANPKCRKVLVDDLGNQFGEIAHITAASPDGPRYNPSMTDDERRSFDNLLLLCEDCNKLVDNKEHVKNYPVELLQKWKSNHENFTSSDVYQIFWKNLNQKITNFEIRKQKTINKSDRYHSTIEILSKDESTFSKSGVNIFSEYLKQLIREKEWNDFPDIFLEGIGGIGKSTELQIAYNELLDVFKNLENYDSYQFCPIPYYFELRDFQISFFQRANEQDNFILFLDGLDELSNSNIVEFQKYINNLRNQFRNIRFIISGRNAAFANLSEKVFINTRIVKLTHNFTNEENAELLKKYKGTKILDVINIPFYRTLLNEEFVTGYKDFFEKLINKRLNYDKERLDYAHNNLKRESVLNINAIQAKISDFCHNLFIQNRYYFSADELQREVEEYFAYIINSSLLSFENEQKICFASNILFEYFLALYFSNSSYSKIRKELFLASGRLNIKYINIIGILLVLLDKQSCIWKFLTKQLKKESNAFILLTDFDIFTDEERFLYYKSIYYEFNSGKEHIFYLNHNRKHGIFSNIESLCESMYNLLPDSKKDAALEMLISDISVYLEKPNEFDIYILANAIILLGIWNTKLWNEQQQEKIKKICIPIINFFVFNPIAKKHLRGLLSERLIYNWYFTYKWTSIWNYDDWFQFIKSINPNMKGFYTISDEIDYKIKIYLFIQFYTDPVISKLVVPLSIYILSNDKDDIGGAGFVPEEIDDDYKIPVSHFDEEIFEFNAILKNFDELSCDEIITVIHTVIKPTSNLRGQDYESKELFNLLLEKWKKNINNPTNENDLKIFEIIKILIQNKNGIYLPNFSLNLNYLSDSAKEYILDCIIKERKTSLLKDERFIYVVFSNLLNLENKEKAEKLFDRIEKTLDEDLFKDIIRAIRSGRINHILKNKADALLEKYFCNEIEIEKEKKTKITNIETDYSNMLKKESSLIQSKELILSEIEKINEYLTGQKEIQDELNRHDIYELSIDRIKDNITFDYRNNYSIPPVFSNFCINYIRNCYKEDYYDKTILTVKKNIENWFSDENLYWRFFFWHYICEYQENNVNNLLHEDSQLKNKLLLSLENNVKSEINNLTIHNADIGLSSLYSWLTPFILSLKYLYDNRIPDWFPKEKLPMLTVYSSWHLKPTPGVLDTNFPWLNYSSVFVWLIEIGNLDRENLIRQSFSYYQELTQPESKAQLLHYYIENIKDLTSYKNEIMSLIIKETLDEIKEDYSEKNSSVLNWNTLSSFWYNTKDNYIDELINHIPFETYKIQNRNSCLTTVIEYFIRMASEEQKKIIIKNTKIKKICKSCYQL